VCFQAQVVAQEQTKNVPARKHCPYGLRQCVDGFAVFVAMRNTLGPVSLGVSGCGGVVGISSPVKAFAASVTEGAVAAAAFEASSADAVATLADCAAAPAASAACSAKRPAASTAPSAMDTGYELPA